MKKDAQVSRRSFARAAGGAVAALGMPTIVPARALGRDGKSPAGDRITLGFIGMGKQNGYHLGAFLGRPETEVLAVCDCDTKRREHARKRVDEHRDKEKSKGSASGDCKGYNDFRELLQRNDIDAVVIATPDHWHAIQIIEACKAGKDIYCEKPLTLTILEAKRVIEAVKKHDRVLQTGSQQRTEYDGKFRKACEYVRSGRIGKILSVHGGVGGPSRPCDLPEEPMEPGLDWDLWLGPAPRRPYNSVLSPRGVHNHFPAWRDYIEYSGGAMTDFGAHHFDIAQWGLDRDDSGPVRIIPPEDSNATRGLRYVYDDGVTLYHGGPNGVTFMGTTGLIYVDRGELRSVPGDVLKKPLEQNDVHLPSAKNHHSNWLECLRSRKPPIADVGVGAHSVTVCHLGNLAYWHHRELHWDPKNWQFVGDAEASKWIDRERHDPWQLPEI
jgi:predicted dehydrogenase